MRLRISRYLPIALGLMLLDAPLRADAVACNVSDCLTNSSIAQRVQPTTVNTDDHGDVTFFASQSGQLPNVMFILDNSTSMYELPQNVGAYPNASFVSSGVTANGTTAASCHSNTWLEGRKDSNLASYAKTTTYNPPDPFYNADPKFYFNPVKYYKYMEWTSAAPGGNATATGSSGACSAMSSALNSGGTGQTQQQRCQQCLDEAGYYIKPGTTGSSSDVTGGNILFKGNWLNFYPPKFLIARKVLTDFISSQTNSPTPVRIGVTTYDPANTSAISQPSPSTGLQTNDGGALISSGMVPDCSVTSWRSGTAPTQQAALLTAIRGTWSSSAVTGGISWGSMGSPIATPLAETLFNVGQFFTGDNNLYKTFLPGATGSPMTTQWIKSAFTAPTGNNKPLCVSCQVNAVVLVTDGEPYGDNNVPYLLRQNGIGCADCGTDMGNSSANTLAQVANYLATTDLNTSLTGTQDVITFVIGLGLSVPILNETAKFGKTGNALRADNAQDLVDSVNGAVINIVARATAFSSTAIQTLEVGTGSTAYVPRFLPSSPADPVWEGHLFRFDLYNEFVAGVDKNGDGKLDSVFLVDKDGDIVTEDDKGNFHKSICSAGVCNPAGPAIPIWDAGGNATVPGKTAQLNVPGSNANRNIYTGIWDSTNSVWNTVLVPVWNGSGSPPATFSAIENYLNIDGNNACASIQAAMASPIPAAYLSSGGTFDRDHCAKAILDYARGQNILNDNPVGSSTSLNRNRMLGDIFHSSPVVVDPPVDQFICSLGLHSQCVSTLYGYQISTSQVTAIPTDQYTIGSGSSQKTIDAYEKYWEDHETRQRVVLVGSNDGLVHAFDAGSAISPLTLNPNIGFRQVQYDSGGGGEVWGFIPPDQLSRLWLMMRDGHQMYNDGDIMVRDVWVDGKKNDPNNTTYSNKPMIKQDAEYHTVAIISERQGGNHFVAIDVTDTTKPTMLWMYPPPCSADEQPWGQTWGQFSPRPPPIGPVLLQTTNTAGPANYGYTHTEERWVVFLNGGHDPYNNRGRAAAILDVFSGAPLFKASYNPTPTDPADPAAQMRFGFPATAGLVDYGRGSSFAPDGFFDTAVIGDEGGQIWTFRFGEPGHLNLVTNLVDNWTFGRAFEPKSGATNDTRYHQPIYTVPSTTVQPENGWLRAYVGTGDRAHVRSQGGGDCRPDDPMSCISAGCTVSAVLNLTNGTNQYSSNFRSGSGTSSTTPVMGSPTQSPSIVSSNACNLTSASETVTVSSCPTTAMNMTESASFSCSVSPYTCSESPLSTPVPDANRGLASTATPGDNSFVSVAVLADSTGISPSARTRRINLPADADTYDTNRLSVPDLIDVSATTSTTTTNTGNVASRNDAGWLIGYTNIDEKTVTSATILGGCVIWSSLIPSGGSVGCASAGASIAPFYQADAMTGAPNCASSFLTGNNYVRSIQRNVISPPPEPSPAVAVGAGGKSMRFSTLEIQPGASEVTQMTVNTSSEMLQMLYSLPLTSDQHACRHVDPAKCN